MTAATKTSTKPRLTKTKNPKIMGVFEVAELLGVSQSRASSLADGLSRVPMPKPIAILHCGRIWDAAEVKAWAKKRKPQAGRIKGEG